MVQYFTYIEGINMDISELTQVLNKSGLSYREIGTAVYKHLEPIMEHDHEYETWNHLECYASLIQFYLAAKTLREEF